jgi:hypothetical protein
LSERPADVRVLERDEPEARLAARLGFAFAFDFVAVRLRELDLELPELDAI